MIKRKLRTIDMFGRKVSLTYDGNKKFKTLFGGVMTIVAISLMGLFVYVICSHTTTITLSNMTSYSLSTTATNNTSSSSNSTNSSITWTKTKMSKMIRSVVPTFMDSTKFDLTNKFSFGLSFYPPYNESLAYIDSYIHYTKSDGTED